MSITKICSCGYVGYAALHDKKGTDVVCEHFAKDIEAEATKPQEPVVWNDGYPTNPWDSEWFIAKTKYGDKVVLRKLPDEYTYDFTTADGTYMKKENITKWMQFPESEFIAPHPVSDMDILDIVLKIGKEMGLEDDEANFEFAQRVIAEATPQPCQSCAEKQSAIDVWEGRYADLSAKCAELEAELLNKEGMTCGDCNDTGWLENREEGRYPCTCMTEAEPYQILLAERDALKANEETLQEYSANLVTELTKTQKERDEYRTNATKFTSN